MADRELSKDFLTGYYTREGLYPQVQKLLSDYQRYHSPFSLLIIDIDRFKSFNDKYGHATGDEILKYFSNAIRLDLVAEQAQLFRLGGDEFVILFPAKEPDEVKRLAKRMNENLKRTPHRVGDRSVKLSFSAGIASYPANGGTAEELLHRADQAMYFSKQAGRGRVTPYGKFFIVRLEQAARLLSILALAFLVGLGTKIGIQSYPNLENKILGIFSKAETLKAHLREEASQAMRSVGSRFKRRSLVRPPEISAPPPLVQKPEAGSLSAPPTTAWDLVYLKSGGVIQGIILKEDESRLTLQLNISAGKGLLVLDKADVLKIVRED